MIYYGLDNIITYGLMILATIIVIWAQTRINGAYKKYRRVSTKGNLSGQEIARKILDANDLKQIYVVEVAGELTDHYDPSRKVVRLSKDIFHGTSVASVSVAAHECGHAIQDKVGYKMMRIRSGLVPFVNFVSYLGYFGLLVSILGGITGYIKLSILTLCATLIFQLVTLPVEFDASKRALEELERLNLIEKDEKTKSKDMLTAAALTYVAGLISTILNLLRLIFILNDRDRN